MKPLNDASIAVVSIMRLHRHRGLAHISYPPCRTDMPIRQTCRGRCSLYPFQPSYFGSLTCSDRLPPSRATIDSRRIAPIVPRRSTHARRHRPTLRMTPTSDHPQHTFVATLRADEVRSVAGRGLRRFVSGRTL